MLTVSHFNICCETVRWYWKPTLRNGVQNPKYYSRSTIYFNNDLHVRTVTPNNVKKTPWQTGPLPLLKSIQQCQLLSEGYLLRLSTFLDALQMLSVAESFIQCDPVFQYSTEFSDLDATSAD